MSDQQQVDLNELSTEQLQQLRQSLTEEVQVLTNNMSNLRAALQRYSISNNSLNVFNDKNNNNDILVPLTSSMYVPGKLNNIKNVIVDIGTGYYIEKNIDNAKKYFSDKMQYLNESIDSVASIALNKRRDLDTVTLVLQTKLSAIRANEMKKMESQKITA